MERLIAYSVVTYILNYRIEIKILMVWLQNYKKKHGIYHNAYIIILCVFFL